MKKISIIVPMYNEQEVVSICYDRLTQVLEKLDKYSYEIICINDGSTDDSLRILKEYSEKYSNIVLIDKKNEGVSAARNTGLDVAHGEYVMFVDSDDLLQRNTLGKIKEIVSKKNSKRLTIGVYEAQDDEIREVVCCNEAPAPNRNCVFVWSNIYKKSIIDEHGIRFVRGITHGEDSLFSFDFRNFCKEYDSFPYTVYYYRRNRDSVTNTSVKRNLINWINSQFSLIELMKERYRLPEFRNILTLEFWLQITHYLLNQVSKMETQEAIQIGNRLKTNKVCPKFHSFEYIGKGCFGTALHLKYKSIWQRLFVFGSNKKYGYHLLKIRKRFNDSLYGYIIKHPRRFVRHPVRIIKKRK